MINKYWFGASKLLFYLPTPMACVWLNKRWKSDFQEQLAWRTSVEIQSIPTHQKVSIDCHNVSNPGTNQWGKSLKVLWFRRGTFWKCHQKNEFHPDTCLGKPLPIPSVGFCSADLWVLWFTCLDPGQENFVDRKYFVADGDLNKINVVKPFLFLTRLASWGLVQVRSKPEWIDRVKKETSSSKA